MIDPTREQRTKAPLIINPRLFRPLPEDMQGIACNSCEKTQAMWAMAVPNENNGPSDEIYTVCALCFLYESEWGKSRAEDIELLIKDVEDQQDKPFFRTAKGRLMFCEDADKILASIVLISKAVEVQSLAAMRKMSKQ